MHLLGGETKHRVDRTYDADVGQVLKPDGAVLNMVAGKAEVAAPDLLVARQIGAEDLLLEVFKRPDKPVVFRAGQDFMLLRVAISFGDLARQLPAGLAAPRCGEIGRASCRERVCQYV